MSDAVWVYMTAANRQEAAKIGRILVEERLAACVNILGEIESIYWWQDAVTTDTEAAFVAKTRREKLTPLTDRVKELHSYTIPCVVALPIQGGNPDFLDWIHKETQKRKAAQARPKGP